MSTPVIQAVVVLYKVAPENSAAWQGLLAALQQHAELASAIRVLIYDNSPQAHPWITPPNLHVSYVHDGANGGLLAAYCRALSEAQHHGAPWLLLLDDDTQVTAEFVRLQLQMTDELAAQPDVAAVVPRLRSGGVVRSPHARLGWRQAPLPLTRQGPAPVGATAFNSGALLRRTAVEAVGEFPAGYVLDYLDHAMFARFALAGFRLWVLPITLEHPMSWEDPRNTMGYERFLRVLTAEQRFHREYGGLEGALTFRLRCALRAWRYRKWDDKRFAQAYWSMAKSSAF